MDYIALIIGLFVGGAVGFLAANLRSKGNSEPEDNSLDIELGTLRNDTIRLEKELISSKENFSEIQSKYTGALQSEAALESKYAALQEKLEVQKSELSELQERFRKKRYSRDHHRS